MGAGRAGFIPTPMELGARTAVRAYKVHHSFNGRTAVRLGAGKTLGTQMNYCIFQKNIKILSTR
jgi:hypothetical protein